LETEFLLLAGLAFLIAGTVKGALGLGLPTVSISLLSQSIDPRMAIALVLLPAIVSNAWQVYRGGKVMRSVKRLWPYVLSMSLVMFVISFYAASASAATITLCTGLVVVLWTVTSLIKKPPAIPARLDRVAQCVFGAASGVIGGLTALWAPPIVIYLLSSGVSKDDFVRYSGFMLLIGAMPLTLGYILNGIWTPQLAASSALMVLPTLLGFSIGERLRSAASGPQFQTAVLLVFFVMGLNLVRKAVFG